jgi:hypothetical protein
MAMRRWSSGRGLCSCGTLVGNDVNCHNRQPTMRSRDQVNSERDHDYTCKILINTHVSQLMRPITCNGVFSEALKFHGKRQLAFTPDCSRLLD